MPVQVPNVVRSAGCCAMYELYSLSAYHNASLMEPTKEHVEAVIAKAKAGASPPGSLPLLLFFTDAYQPDTTVKRPKYGDRWRKAFKDAGYRVDDFDFKTNPKSNNNVVLYHVYLHQGTDVSKKPSLRKVVTNNESRQARFGPSTPEADSTLIRRAKRKTIKKRSLGIKLSGSLY